MINFITVMSIITLILILLIILLIMMDYFMFKWYKSSYNTWGGPSIIGIILNWAALLVICISFMSSLMVLFYPFT